MYGHAIAQVEPPDVGIHLIWMGPRPWVYSPGGWFIQRRKYRAHEELVCDGLDRNDIQQMHVERERRLRFGTVLLREGVYPSSIGPGAATKPQACMVFTLELDEPEPLVRTMVQARASFAYGLRDGKVVAVGQDLPGAVTHSLHALAIDTVVVYAAYPSSVTYCILADRQEEEKRWTATPIVKELQLPLRELMPHLSSPADEFAEGKLRLLAGETLEQAEFDRLAAMLRAGVGQAGPPRPIDQVLLLREKTSESFEELVVLDPYRVLITHPKWRRVLGFGWFDDDPTLQVGDTYEYRITGYFPAEDLQDSVYGFHTVPTPTALPSEFYLGKLRLRLPQPTAVQRAPDTPESGHIQVSRRGIPLHPVTEPFWLVPSLHDWSLVVDFPTPVSSVILELHPEHRFEYAGGDPWWPFFATTPLPPGPRPRLDFATPIQQLRLRGRGFLYAIRLPAGSQGMAPVSMVLPPVKLVNTPRPEPPLMANIRNLQQSQPVPSNNTPPAVQPPRHALGFEVRWRPALRGGLASWPADADAAPPLSAAMYQLEHRQVTFWSSLSSHTLARLQAWRKASSIPVENLPLISIRDGREQEQSGRALRQADYIDRPEAGFERLATALAANDLETVIELAAEAKTGWQPLFPEENWTLGDREERERDTDVRPNADLMALFPEALESGGRRGLDLYWQDVFDFSEGDNEVRRPLPPPGTYHQYRVRTVDPIGRPGPVWRYTNTRRLEKRLPPPVPVGPRDKPLPDNAPPEPVGVQARVLVKDAPDLTANDQSTLGTDDNAIILRWGWHQQQREQDPFAREFRVYVADKPLDAVAGNLTAVSTIWPGVYSVTLALEQAVEANAAQGGYLSAPYPFYVLLHTNGTTITAVVRALVPDANGNLPVPKKGKIELPLHLTPKLTRPPAWSERLEVQPITAQSEYTAIIRNRLTLTPGQPRDSVWVGVSSADDQFYVPDQLSSATPRPGNESAIVPVLCEARYHGRPTFEVPPPLDPVPVLRTPEPADRPIHFRLNLAPYLAGTGLAAGDAIRPERVSADAVFAAYYATNDNRVMARVVDKRDASETDQEVTVAKVSQPPNPGDVSAVLAALNGNRTDALDDKYVVFLAGAHPYRDRLFEPATRTAVPLGPFDEKLPPKSGRYVYRVRKGDAAGHLSAGAAVAKAIVRVPSLAPMAAPDKSPAQDGDAAGTLRLRIAPEPELTHVLTFSTTPAGGGPLGAAEILRIPNRHDLYPNHVVRLRTAGGTLLVPQVKDLDDADVVVDAQGFRHVQQSFSAGAGERVRVWACTLTRDGIPSRLAGPWSLAMPQAPLPVPTLAVASAAQKLLFTWSWPGVPTYNVALERSLDGTAWERVSPLQPETATQYTLLQPAAGGQYRLRVMSPDGRTAHSNAVTP